MVLFTLALSHKHGGCAPFEAQDKKPPAAWDRGKAQAAPGVIEKRRGQDSIRYWHRHLTSEQKREAIAANLKESPQWADNCVAKLLGVDGKTVRSMRTSLEIRKVEMLEGKDGKYFPRSRTGNLEAELAVTKTDAVRQDIMGVGNRLFLEHASEEERHERAQRIASKWGVSTEHVEDELNSIVEQGPRLKDLGEEKSTEVLEEAFTSTFGTRRQIGRGTSGRRCAPSPTLSRAKRVRGVRLTPKPSPKLWWDTTSSLPLCVVSMSTSVPWCARTCGGTNY